MKSLVVKRSIIIAGHKTSVSLEDAFWTGLKEIAIVRSTTLSNLVGAIDADRKRGNLSSAIRLFWISTAVSSQSCKMRRSRQDIARDLHSRLTIKPAQGWAVAAGANCLRGLRCGEILADLG